MSLENVSSISPIFVVSKASYGFSTWFNYCLAPAMQLFKFSFSEKSVTMDSACSKSLSPASQNPRAVYLVLKIVATWYTTVKTPYLSTNILGSYLLVLALYTLIFLKKSLFL